MRPGKTALYHFGTQLVISVAGFAATFAIGVLGGADVLGDYTLAVAVGFFWLAIPASGVAQAITKRMSERESPGAYYGGGVIVNVALAVGVGSLVLLASQAVRAGGTPSRTILIVLVAYDVEIAVLLVGAVSLRTTLAGLEGQKLVARSGGMKAVDRVLRSVVQIGLIAAGLGVAALTIGHAAVLVVISALALLVGSVRPRVPSRRHVSSLLAYAKYAWVGAFRSRVYGWMDTLMLGIFLSGTAGATLIGVYEVAWGIGSLLATLSTSIRATLFPEMSELSAAEDYERVVHFLDEALAFSGLVVIPGLVGAAVIGERVLRFYRPEYVQGQTVLLILVGAYIADVYANQLLNAVNAVNRPDVAMRVNAAFIVTNVVLNAVLIWQIGWVGAAIATATSAVVRAAGGFVALETLLADTTVPLRTIGAEVAAAGVMGSAIFAVDPMIPPGRVWTLVIVGGGAAVYFAALLGLSTRVRSKTLSLVPAGS